MTQTDSLTYLHGYSKAEQNRLYTQAQLEKDYVYANVDFSKQKHILEIGCGVGAQTQILFKKFPHLKITGIDLSEAQLAAARKMHAAKLKSGQLTLIHMNAEKIGTLKQKFDGAFVCWFLEHVPNPQIILTEARKILKAKAPLYCTEVQNAAFFVNPYSPTILKYWFEFNDYQWASGGNPFMGAYLGNLLKKTNYKNIEVQPKSLIFDNRSKAKRNQFLKLYQDIMLSAAPLLLEKKRVTPLQIEFFKKEFAALLKHSDSIFHYDFVQSKALR